jgi:hypothetical protein
VTTLSALGGATNGYCSGDSSGLLHLLAEGGPVSHVSVRVEFDYLTAQTNETRFFFEYRAHSLSREYEWKGTRSARFTTKEEAHEAL